MLKTTLKLDTVRCNTGKSAVVANMLDGREVWVGESLSVGRKRAIFDVLSGSGAQLEKLLRKLEKQDSDFIARVSAQEDADLIAAAEKLGIDLSDVGPA